MFSLLIVKTIKATANISGSGVLLAFSHITLSLSLCDKLCVGSPKASALGPQLSLEIRRTPPTRDEVLSDQQIDVVIVFWTTIDLPV